MSGGKRLWTAALLTGLTGCMNGPSADGVERDVSPSQEPPPNCNIDDFYRALAADTTAMSGSTQLLEGLSTEGGSATEYYDSAGTRRVLAAEFLGETGRVRQAYFFVNESDYAVERTVWQYDRPITETGIPTAVARQVWTIYVCQGQALTADYIMEARNADRLLQSMR